MTDDLQRDHEALIQFLYLCPVGVVQVDRTGNVSMMNPVATQLLMPLAPRGRIDNLVDILEPWAASLRNRIFDHSANSGAICKDLRIPVDTVSHGRAIRRVLSLTLIQVDSQRLTAVLSDITDIVAQERELQDKESHLRAIFDSVREFALYTVSLEGQILSWNRSGERLMGYSEAEAIGEHFSRFYPPEEDRQALARILDRARTAGWAEDEGTRLRRDGTSFCANSLTTVLLGEDGELRGFTRVTRDVTLRRKMERELHEMARTDHLTGIANRRHVLELGEVEVARARRHRRPLSVLCMDIDRFKQINDSHGHAAGDTILKAFTATCKDALRETDILGRIGGEEFLAVLPDTGGAAAREVAERVRLRVEGLTVETDDKNLGMTVSIGVAGFPEAGAELHELIQTADERLYEAKNSGRNRVVAAAEPTTVS